MKTNNAATIFGKYAKVYEDKFMDSNLFYDTYDSFLSFLPRNDSAILDIGCGSGNITKYLLDNNPELNILGIDIADEMLLLAKEKNPSANFKILETVRKKQLIENNNIEATDIVLIAQKTILQTH